MTETDPLFLLFVDEARDHLERAEENLLRLSRNPSDGEALNACFRALHSIKGCAGYFDLPRVRDIAHASEHLLDRLRRHDLATSTHAVEALLQSVTCLGAIIAALGTDDSAIGHALADEDAALIARLVGIAGQTADATASPGHALAPVDAEARERLGDLLVEHGVTRRDVEEVAAALRPGERLGDRLVADGRVARATVERAARQQVARQGGDGFSRVPTARLEELVTLVGELLIDQATIAGDAAVTRQPELRAAVTHQARIVRDLQTLALALRMVPLKSVFRKVERAVHDAAARLGKTVDLVLEGEATEIDRTIAEALADPLLHMARNAVDHGLEPTIERERAGKPAAGRVTLRAAQSGDQVLISMSDDGRGLDPERIRRAAIERGLIPRDATLSAQDCQHLIFTPGFSTARAITDISGRGVGLDVVHRNVQDLKGAIEVASVPGTGATFTLRLPLTTAILDAMLLRVGTERFLVPIGSVVEASRIRPGQITGVMGSRRVVESRGQMLPVASLRELLGIIRPAAETEDTLVVVNHYRGRYALQVDDIIGQQQVVIKPLTQGIPHHPGLAGSAILADGRVGLILDPGRLVRFGAAA